jgi:hypothetical protein
MSVIVISLLLNLRISPYVIVFISATCGGKSTSSFGTPGELC